MPSGRTHDSITLWSLPVVAGLTFERTHNAGVTLILSGSYLFSGLMFGPDLDVYSQQYKRWGVLRWIWLPYRRSMRHRSFLSHGFLIGTVIRVLYLLTWITICLAALVVISAIAYQMTGEAATWTQFSQYYWTEGVMWLGRSLQNHTPEWVTLLIGLELGSLSHSLSDWVGSRYKRLSPQKPKKAPSPKRSTPAQPPATSRIELPTLPENSKLPPFK
ncbi:MAG: metal-binding protein [Leptolyngbyaceae cyanobacterium bins.302]|nr:metal-binding protein [Leptolyngbyaceae cyanobacterium bins.302]